MKHCAICKTEATDAATRCELCGSSAFVAGPPKVIALGPPAAEPSLPQPTPEIAPDPEPTPAPAPETVFAPEPGSHPAHTEALQELRRLIRDKTLAATCLGFGPRFLHSTGQAYKGGPNSGVVLQLTCADAEDLPVPGQSYSFGVVKAAQARGDFDVLAERGRRLLRVHLPADVASGLKVLGKAVEEALR